MPLIDHLKRLADFQPTPLPVISLYLNAQPDQHGRDNVRTFVRKALGDRLKTYPLRSPERVSFERDVERIERYLDEELRPSANGVAVFACSGAEDFFEAVQLDAPIEQHRLYVYHQPHLYPLARLQDRYPRYAALVADTNSARIFVFGIGIPLERERVTNVKTSRTSVGGWSQARYQRHTENYHLQHAKEVAEALGRVVREEEIEHIVLAGDEVVIPLLRDQLSAELAERVIDVVRLDITTPEHEVLRTTLEALHESDARNDAERVERLLDEYRAGGLAVVGIHDTLLALTNGQVDELFVGASVEEAHVGLEELSSALAPAVPVDEESERPQVKVADQLVSRAVQTGAKVVFIEDAELLSEVGGVGAFLRFRVYE